MGFNTLKTYCFFIGYPRSGHSFLGQCINTREDALIAHECNALFHVAMEKGLTASKLFQRLRERNHYFAVNLDYKWETMDYKIHESRQLNKKDILCIGDKKAQITTCILKSNEKIIAFLRQLVRVPIRAIHYVRNPLDNIATIAFRDNLSLENALYMYMRLAEENKALLNAVLASSEALTVYHEDFIANPEKTLCRVSSYLALPRDTVWERLCREKTYTKPACSRTRVPWTITALRRLIHEIADVPFLRRYLPEVAAFEAAGAERGFVCLPGADLWQRSLRAFARHDRAAALQQALDAVRLGYAGYSQYVHLAKMYLELRPELAASYFDKALACSPSCSEALFQLAKLAVGKGDFALAEEQIAKWQEIGARPKGWGYFELSKLLREQGRLVEAVRYSEKSMAANGNISYYKKYFDELTQYVADYAAARNERTACGQGGFS
jgi:hypothetical protein